MTARRTGHSRLDLADLSADGPAPLEAMFRALVEEIPAILYINGPQEHAPTLYVSPQTVDICGVQPEQWYDDTWSSYVHPDDVEGVDEKYVDAVRHGAILVDEYRFVRPDGQLIWLRDTNRVIRDDRGRPALVQGVMFDVTASKRNEELLQRHAETLERIAAIGQRFTELLLSGGDLQAILDTLADIIRRPVAFDDSARQLVGFAGTPQHDDASVLETWERHSRSPHADGARDGCDWTPVRLRDEEWGRLHAFDPETAADHIDSLAIDRAAAAIALWLLSGHDRAALADRARSELIADLWQGRAWSGADALARSRSLGRDLDQPVLAAIAVEFSWAGERADRHDDPGAKRLLASAQARLQRLAEAAGVSCMAATVGTVCLAIVGLSTEEPVRAVTGRLAQQLHAAVKDDLRGRVMSVGISRPGSADVLRRVLTEATDAASHGAHSLRLSGSYHSADLGIRQLLAHLGDGPELGRFVEDELGPLLAHDAKGRSPLIPTLRAYLESGGQKATAARALHLERRSLYYRLERIQDLLEADLDDASVRLRAQVALQGLDVLRQRHSGAFATTV